MIRYYVLFENSEQGWALHRLLEDIKNQALRTQEETP